MVAARTRPSSCRLLWLLGLLTGCSLLVEPRQDHPRCLRADGGSEVCPTGLECREGRCEIPCELEVCGDLKDNDCDGLVDEPDLMAVEICGDRKDNNCDGTVDEPNLELPDICGDGVDNNCNGDVDEGSDHDGDSFTWCGDTRNATAGRESLDCDDYNAMAYPKAVERCDGVDNDCDNATDEDNPELCPEGTRCIDQRCVAPSCAVKNSGVACQAGERCDLLLQRCVTAQVCTATSCAGDEYCDPATHACRKRDPSANGAACLVDADCKSGSCIDAAALRLAEGARVCGQACCDDRECAPDERCFASGTGARSCLPKKVLPESPLTQCSSDDVCQSPAICALNKNQSLAAPLFTPRAELITSTCRADDLGKAKLGGLCLNYLYCDSKVCVPRPGFGQLCSTTCGSSSDCAAFAVAAGSRSEPEPAYCRYTSVSFDKNAAVQDYAAVCVLDRGDETGPGGYGAECASPADCADRGCVGAMPTMKGRCTPICCNDSDCGVAVTGKQTRCRPFAFGLGYQMRCAL